MKILLIIKEYIKVAEYDFRILDYNNPNLLIEMIL